MLPSAKEVVQEVRSKGGVMNTLCDFIIRPPRADYEIEDLGPDLFRLGDKTDRFVRDDFTVENMRGMTIYCSWYKPYNYTSKAAVPTTSTASTVLPNRAATTETTTTKRSLPCVVYCHANCGSRYDGLEAMLVLKHGFTLVTFDFCGSGWSDGEYISLGFYERQDLAMVIDYLQSRPNEVDGIGLWGRSMGAVTSIMYASKDPSIRCVICDSPFGTLRWLIQDLVTNYGGRTAKYLPGFVVKMIVNKMRDRITKRASFDIDDLDAVKYALNCTVPGLIFHGKEDDFVLPKQSIKVSESFMGPCVHQLVEGGHNSERSEEITDLIIAYLRLYLIEKPAAARMAAAAEEAKSTPGASTSTTSSPTSGRTLRAALSSLEVQRGTNTSESRPTVPAETLRPHITSSTSVPPRPGVTPPRRRTGVETPPAMPSSRTHSAPRAHTPPPLSSETKHKATHLGLVKMNPLTAKEEPIDGNAETERGSSASGTHGVLTNAFVKPTAHLTGEEEGDGSDRSAASSFLGGFVDPTEVPRALPIHFTKPRMDRVSQGADVSSEADEESDDSER